MSIHEYLPGKAMMSDIPKYSREQMRDLPKFEKGVSFLSWAYNEEELIGPFIHKMNRLLSKTIEDYEIIVIDDGSTDKTGSIVREIQKDIPAIKLFCNERNMDVGYSMQRAVGSASKEYLFWQTVDWAYDIGLLRYFLELLRYRDVVAGVRYAPGLASNRTIDSIRSMIGLFSMKHLRTRSDNLNKAFISIINYMFIRSLFQTPMSDFQNVVFYPTRFVQSFTLESNSSFTNPEMLVQAYWKGASIVEVPISFIPRQAGTAKGTRVKAVIASVSDIYRLWFKWMVMGRRGPVVKGRITPLDRSQWEMTE